MNKLRISLFVIWSLLGAVHLGFGQGNNPSWKLAWSDEFNSDKIDTTYWTVQDSYWKKNIKCLYKPEQVTVENGNLIISTIEKGEHYHTGQLKSNDKVEIGYGKIELRMKMPKGAGLKTAFWMLGINKDTVGWPRCGEIDIVEQLGFEPKITHHNIHWYNETQVKTNHGSYILKSENELTEEWHVYSLLRDEKKISYYMDGSLLNEYTISESMTEFKNLYYFIIQLDTGDEKTWPGAIDRTMNWPKKLHIDYIRYYKPVI